MKRFRPNFQLPWSIRRWIGRISVPNLMTYVVMGMAGIFVCDWLIPQLNLYQYCSLSWNMVMRGQIWRLVTFIFLPPNSSIVWIIFSLYFYWMIGSALENQWGSSRFTLFYLIGMLGTIIASALTGGYVSNSYLNMSLFLAFAALYPNHQLLIFMMIPVKVKYLAIIDVILYLISFVTGTWADRITIVLALANILLFLGGDIMNTVRQEMGYYKTRRNFRRAMRGR